ncbi:MAG: preprotein translocase subunit YajC [Bacteroides sp.]|nr:preprotein translocase subunit YajC [Bacteroides sp.]
MNFLNPIILMTPPAEGGAGGIGAFLPLILLIVVFYFFFIRPQMKKQKDLNKFRENLKKGDKIITIGGIHGKIIEINDKTFIIEVEGQNRLKIERSAVSQNAVSENLAETR